MREATWEAMWYKKKEEKSDMNDMIINIFYDLTKIPMILEWKAVWLRWWREVGDDCVNVKSDAKKNDTKKLPFFFRNSRMFN